MVLRFVQWYNDEHRHSGIRYVTPGQRHAGQDRPLLEARHAVYQDARDRTPTRWSRQTRNWTPITTVTLNPQARYAGPGGDVTNPAASPMATAVRS
jgi:putative transposase